MCHHDLCYFYYYYCVAYKHASHYRVDSQHSSYYGVKYLKHDSPIHLLYDVCSCNDEEGRGVENHLGVYLFPLGLHEVQLRVTVKPEGHLNEGRKGGGEGEGREEGRGKEGRRGGRGKEKRGKGEEGGKRGRDRGKGELVNEMGKISKYI